MHRMIKKGPVKDTFYKKISAMFHYKIENKITKVKDI